MAKRTITPVSEPSKMLKVKFGSTKFSEIGRVDAGSGWIKFVCYLGKGFEKLFDAMDWQVPDDHVTAQSLEGKLEGGSFTMTSKGEKLVDGEVEIDFGTISGFKCLRMELEGRKGKGFRRELRFEATLKSEDGLALMESYMRETDNARGVLTVNYRKEPVQQTLPEDDSQLKLDDERKAATGKDADQWPGKNNARTS